MAKADLLVGVDSGPLHLARFTDLPAVGVWMPGHYPTTYSVPRPQQLNVVLADPTRAWNRYKRIPWRIVEQPGSAFDPDRLAEFCAQMLHAPRYLSRAEIAADVQLQQFVRSWCRGAAGNTIAPFADRHRSFDLLLREMVRRFPQPTVVETGTIRSEEDWAGAGFSTYLLGAFLSRHGGRLHSVDLSAGHCAFARTWTEIFGPAVTVHTEDSVAFLRRFPAPIDVLYLDSLDTTEPGHAEHALRELEAALPRLHNRSLLLVDDTAWAGGNWAGKGARVVPWLTDRGWRILYGGYQVLLSKE
jgi:predicted O-methyltransferase YrrM